MYLALHILLYITQDREFTPRHIAYRLRVEVMQDSLNGWP